ncbi:hypothetical protein DL546_007882 [Coniochaeta pulveracea]|uniref:Uncharacterized protein n=1 Tax=Coniochaeta pulveracea TaxID=177199 RepID=A0A420YEY5_9PEZI|nr:hypothetical protein DL546_007882 [Coniochaeta pulveracea]
MSSEDEQLKARIAAMAGQINRVKNQQAGFVPPPPAHHYPPQRGGYNARYQRPAPYATRHRGRGGIAPVHRHKTLVLNSATPTNNSPDGDSGTDSSSSSWVQKNDRHLQLINKSVYNQDSQARIQAMEQTRRQKLASRDQQERAKLFGHLNRVAQTGEVTNARGSSSTPREIVINGVRYLVSKNGSKLVRAPDETSSLKSTPKVTEIAGVKFRRSKTGNLIRQGVVKAQRRQMGIKKVNEPCRMFSTTGTSLCLLLSPYFSDRSGCDRLVGMYLDLK